MAVHIGKSPISTVVLAVRSRGQAHGDLRWTQDEAIAFECAREVITDMMAIQTGQIAEEASKAAPDADCLASLRAERSRLAQERAALHVDDLADVARIRTEYGAIVRAWREEHHTVSIEAMNRFTTR